MFSPSLPRVVDSSPSVITRSPVSSQVGLFGGILNNNDFSSNVTSQVALLHPVIWIISQYVIPVILSLCPSLQLKEIEK